MRNHSFPFWVVLALLVDGVLVAVTDEVKPVSVMKGDSVILNTGVSELQSDNTIEWIFGDKLIIAKMEGKKISIIVFRDKLNLENENGSLIIKDITNEQEGLYKVDIRGRYETSKRFNVTVREAMKTVSVKKGESVTLHTGVIEIQGYDLIKWKFEEHLIAEINQGTNLFILEDSSDERFKGRLQLSEKSGSLTISDSETTDSGVYHLNMISSSHTVQRTISVTVKAFIPDNHTPDSGLHPGYVALISVIVLVMLVAAVTLVICYRTRNQTSEFI
ncbi:uncharacterized protein LOC143735443 isoform X2 [Siphateles boraxobius]|uniref:uncharacterized protein LOC143735443 isoform X2 n=1 Tax=Siphateles boraxobius TaxID=180520 RepID=UPI004062CC4C